MACTAHIYDENMWKVVVEVARAIVPCGRQAVKYG
jgi:hypothetical protein